VCYVDSVAPRFVETLEELLSPQQSVWMMPNKELTKKYARLWTHGRTDVFGPGLEWPEMCKTTALFTKQRPLLEWNDSMAPVGTSTEDIAGFRTFYENYGIIQKHAQKVMRAHFFRRLTGEHPPMEYESQDERHVMTIMQEKKAYDKMMDLYSRMCRVPDGMPRLGHGPLWKDHEAMDR
jgi:hypothetical protein